MSGTVAVETRDELENAAPWMKVGMVDEVVVELPVVMVVEASVEVMEEVVVVVEVVGGLVVVMVLLVDVVVVVVFTSVIVPSALST